MKILHVLTQLPQKTGSGVYFTNLIKSLEDMGHENLALYGREEDIDLDFPIKNYEEVLYMTDKLPFHICGMSDVMPYESTVYSQMTEGEIDLLLEAFEEKLIKIKKRIQTGFDNKSPPIFPNRPSKKDLPGCQSRGHFPWD